MPVYEYICDNCGSEDSEHRSMADSDKKKKCVICNKTMRRNFQAEAPGRRARCDTYPMVSSAAGGHVDDTKRMMEDDKKLGIRETQYTDGDPIFRSKGHRKEYCEAHGFYALNASDSDPCPKNR